MEIGSQNVFLGNGSQNGLSYSNRSSGYSTLAASESKPAPVSNERNLALMQDIVIEQILSGDSVGQQNGTSIGVNSSSGGFLGGGSTNSRFGRFQRRGGETTSSIAAHINQMDGNLESLSASTRMLMGNRMKVVMDNSLPKDHDAFTINLHDHDQLPTADDYRMTQGLTGGRATNDDGWYSLRGKILTLCLIVSLCLSFTILGAYIDRKNVNHNPDLAGTSLSFPGFNHHTGNSSESSDLTDDYVSGGITAEVANSSVLETLVLEGATRYEQMVSLVKQMKWSHPEAFNSQLTPQSKAASFVANTDTLQVPLDPTLLSLVQRYVLAVLFYSTDGPNSWIRRFQFLSEEPECAWNEFWSGNEKDDKHAGSGVPGNVDGFHPVGVICDDSPTIQRLYFPSNNLVGNLPIELALLTDLKEMNFYDNSITGKIHGTWQYLKKLEALVLYKNQIHDVIPMWIGDELSSLQVLNLGNNHLFGTLPSNLDLLPSLAVLNCEQTKIDGTLHPLHNASSLESIHFGSSHLSGRLTDELVNSWTNLKELDLGNNTLSGSLPQELLDNDHLMMIDLHGNQFTGEVPQLHPNSNLRVLALQNNKLSGRIDSLIANLPAAVMQHLDLSNNLFVGPAVPNTIGQLTELRYLFLANLKKVDREPIPTEIGLLTNLVDLSLQNSNRIGTIPFQLKDLTKLILLDLNNNFLQQDIPDELASLQNLRFLLLRSNELSGPIPEGFYQLSNLDTFVLDSNNNINSGARAFCQLNLPSLRVFQADCATFAKEDGEDCSCCTKCCDDDKVCEDDFFFADMDPSAQYQYVRKFYQLHEEDIIFPVRIPKPDTMKLPMFNENKTITSENDRDSFVYAPYDVITHNEQVVDASQPAGGEVGENNQVADFIDPWTDDDSPKEVTSAMNDTTKVESFDGGSDTLGNIVEHTENGNNSTKATFIEEDVNSNRVYGENDTENP